MTTWERATTATGAMIALACMALGGAGTSEDRRPARSTDATVSAACTPVQTPAGTASGVGTAPHAPGTMRAV